MRNRVGQTRVMRLDERLRDVAWPTLEATKCLDVGEQDCLIVCAGFEERAVSALRRACEGRAARFVLYVVTYLPEQVQNRVEEIRRIAARSGVQKVEIRYDRRDPMDVTERMADITRTHARVYVDVSGMSRLLIVQCVVGLIEAGCERVSVLYSEPKTYVPSRDEFERDRRRSRAGPGMTYLSAGIFEIAAVPALASVAMLGEPIRLIAFPSLDPTQLSAVVQELQPGFVDFVHGVPSRDENVWRQDAIRWLNQRTLREGILNQGHEVSTFDYRETLQLLLRIYEERSKFDRLIVAPTGSKMQAVAVGLFRGVLPDIQIVYPTPQSFLEPERYTVGHSTLYRVDLPREALALAEGNEKSPEKAEQAD